jgi:DNA-binding response OmpR family regulator
MNKIKILFVEDDEVVSTMYRIKFEKEGYEVNICPN